MPIMKDTKKKNKMSKQRSVNIKHTENNKIKNSNLDTLA